MTMVAREVLERARRVLNDEDSVRWTLDELRVWLNDGMREVVLQKPEASSKTFAHTLVEGTLQTLPSAYHYLLRVRRNLKTDARSSGAAITVIDRDILDAQMSDWHDSVYVPFEKTVRHVVFDEADPRSFYVYPGNDGTGRVELVASQLPADVLASPTPDNIATYTTVLALPDIYRGALVDYVCYRAFIKDAQFSANAARGATHYQAFANAVGFKIANDMAKNPNRKPSGEAAA